MSAASLSTKTKLVIVAGILLLAAGFVYGPKLLGSVAPAPAAIAKFQVTPQPKDAYNQAVSKGRPIFLEFYAKW